MYMNLREGVGTLNFTTTTGNFFQNIENGFWVDHNYDITTSKMAFELITTSKRMKRTSKRSVLSEFHILTTYGVSTYGILVLTKTF